ncbi:MAG: hypothetical protein Q7J35_10660 [Candidatus Methanoperedens sp.]|nr:hypothetical protein [Candidatus Methanoperedens sp.]
MLIFIHVSSAESGIVSENSNTGFDGANPIIRYYANNTDEIQIDYSPDNGDYWQNPDYTLRGL